MAPPLLSLQGVMLTLGGKPLLDGADLSVAPGARICLVGRNGSGKSTLLKIAAGEIEADDGQRFMQPGASLRYLPQEPDFSGFASTLAYAEAGLGPLDEPYAATTLLRELGLSGAENPATLSGGEARRAALPERLLWKRPVPCGQLRVPRRLRTAQCLRAHRLLRTGVRERLRRARGPRRVQRAHGLVRVRGRLARRPV